MKVALLLSGHFRSHQRTFGTLRDKILNKHAPDIFISSWDCMGFDGVRGDGHMAKTKTDINAIKQLYRPKNIIIEPEKRWDTSKYIGNVGSGLRNPEILFSMFYGVYKANQLKCEYEKSNNFKYDVVIRSRPDVFLENELDISDAEQQSGIWFPKFGNYSGLNDQFAFGDSRSMDLYSELYNNLDTFFSEGCMWHAETMVKYNVNHYGIQILRSDIKFQLLRANGAFFRSACETHLGDIK